MKVAIELLQQELFEEQMEKTKLNDKIYNFIKKSKPVKQASIQLLINHFKEQGFSEQEIIKAIDKLRREGSVYEWPKSICLISIIS